MLIDSLGDELAQTQKDLDKKKLFGWKKGELKLRIFYKSKLNH
jgi:hypothetical protein